MSSLHALGKHIDKYKQAKSAINTCDGTVGITSTLEEVKAVATLSAREILRYALLDLGIRAENIYTEDNKLVFDLEPGGIPQVLHEMLSRRKE